MNEINDEKIVIDFIQIIQIAQKKFLRSILLADEFHEKS